MSVQPPQISPSTKYRKFAPNFYLISTKSSRDGETTIAVIRWVAQPGLRNRGDTSTFSGGKRLRREKISSETSSSIRVFSFRSCCLSLHEFFQRFCAALPAPPLPTGSSQNEGPAPATCPHPVATPMQPSVALEKFKTKLQKCKHRLVAICIAHLDGS